MKSNFFVEFHGNKVLENTLTTKVKEIWKEAGNKVKDLETLDVYYKPDEKTCYYVFNGTDTGSFVVDEFEA